MVKTFEKMYPTLKLALALVLLKGEILFLSLFRKYEKTFMEKLFQSFAQEINFRERGRKEHINKKAMLLYLFIFL